MCCQKRNDRPLATDDEDEGICDDTIIMHSRLSSHHVNHDLSQSCTGTRTALQSGRFPVHVQTSLKNPEDPSSGMPRNLTGLAEYMKQEHYATHYVGKWDVGMASPQHTPKGRGYDTSLHYFEHKNDFWTQACMQSACCSQMQEPGANVTTANATTTIYDLWDTDRPARDVRGMDYEEFIFQRRMLDLIDRHADKMDEEEEQQSMFLFYAPHVAHCPLQVPQSYLDQFEFMDNDEDLCQAQTSTIVGPNDTTPTYSCRKQYHAMVKLLDDILESLVQRLQSRGMWDNTLMVVTSDNGGPVSPDESGATNFPLRGGKYSVFEGGVRAAAFVSGGFLPVHRRGQRVMSPIHISDWYATLPALAGIDVLDGTESLARFDDPRIPPVDGINVWPLLAGDNNDDNSRFHDRELPLDTTALLIGDYKLIWREDKNVSESGWTDPAYPNAHTGKHGIRNKSVNCSTGCLFNVADDPSEKQDIASSHPARLRHMQQRLVELRRGFFENDDRGIDSCPKGYNDTDKDLLCACWMAVNYYGGFFGPYQDVDVAAASLSLQQQQHQHENMAVAQ